MMTPIQKLMMLLQLDQSYWLILQAKKVLVFIPTIILQLIVIFLLLKVCFLMIKSLKSSIQKRNFVWYVMFAVFFIFLLHQQRKILQKNLALVVKESAFVYAGPEQSFHTIFQLKSGTYVQCVAKTSNMTQISINGQCGWVVTENIEIQ